MVGRLRYVHIHLAGFGAFSAGYTLVFVHLYLKERYPVEQRVKRPQRTEPLAEGTVEYYAQHNHGKQDAEFPCKQASQRRPDTGIGKGQRDGPLHHALRTEVFTEERVAHAYIVYKERRQQENHHQQYGVLEVSQGLEFLCGELLRGNFMQQFLKPAEGAQKTADKASKQDAEQNEKACDIIGKTELGRAHYRLKRPDGTSAGGCRAGVAIQPGHTDGFPCALVQFALEKVRQVQVGQ